MRVLLFPNRKNFCIGQKEAIQNNSLKLFQQQQHVSSSSSSSSSKKTIPPSKLTRIRNNKNHHHHRHHRQRLLSQKIFYFNHRRSNTKHINRRCINCNSSTTTHKTTTLSSLSSLSSLRFFFFCLDLNNNNKNYKIKKSFFSSSSSISDDPYDIYRNINDKEEEMMMLPIVKLLLKDENQRTQDRISSILQQTLFDELNYIAAASAPTTTTTTALDYGRQEEENKDDNSDDGHEHEHHHSSASASAAEYGPTGTWKYQFAIQEENGRRIYQRSLKVVEGDDDDQQQLVLEFAHDTEILALSISVDESYIACLFTRNDNNNNNNNQRQQQHQQRNIIFRCIETNQQRMLKVPNSIVSLEFGPIRRTKNRATNDNDECYDNHHSIYMVATDTIGRPNRILVSYINLNSLEQQQPQQPTVIFQSDDPSVFVDVQRTKGCQYVAIQAITKLNNEIYLSNNNINNDQKGDADDDDTSSSASLQLVIPRQDLVQYHLDVGNDDDVVIMISENGSEYHIIETTIDKLPLESGVENMLQQSQQQEDESTKEEKKYVSMMTSSASDDDDETSNYAITDMDLFKNYLVLYELSTITGKSRIRVQSRRKGSSDDSTKNQEEGHQYDDDDDDDVIVPIDDDLINCGKITPCGNINYNSTSLRFQLESPIQLGSIYEYEFDSRQLNEIIQIPGNNSEDMQQEPKQERIFVESADGTSIPLSLIYRDDDDETAIHGGDQRPVILVGYGAYGEPINLGYDPSWVPLYSRGYVLAFAHTRGGGDLGRSFYEAGRQANKIKAIEDFEACAHYLQKRWKGGQLIAKAFSAGGVLVGAAVNRNPNLFDKVVLTNAFLDVYKTLKNPNLFLTVHEWDEYGNVLHDPAMAKIVESYCPISNIPSSSTSMSSFPETLVIGTLDDENVPYWNSVIYALKVRETAAANNIYLHLEETGQHHLGTRKLPVSAMELAFIIDG